MPREHVAKWIFDSKTSILSLFDARKFDAKSQTNEIYESINLNEIPFWDELPEYAKVALQFGIRQGAGDGWGSAELTPSQKLEGMASDLRDYQKATFARAKFGREDNITSMINGAENLVDMEMLPRMLVLMKKVFNPAQKALFEAKKDKLEQEQVLNIKVKKAGK